MVFNVVPTAFEVTLVAGILAYKCGPALAALTAGTIATYTVFTFGVTQVIRTDTEKVLGFMEMVYGVKELAHFYQSWMLNFCGAVCCSGGLNLGEI